MIEIVNSKRITRNPEIEIIACKRLVVFFLFSRKINFFIICITKSTCCFGLLLQPMDTGILYFMS